MKKVVCIILAGMVLAGCSLGTDRSQTDSERGSWAKGCDLSWLSEMEEDGVQFRDERLESRDCIELLRGEGMNAVRLRVWVNHSTGWSNKGDMLGLAKRAVKAGQRVMIDIHYSDFFADPSHQEIPAAWQDFDYEQMKAAVREHTLDVLRALQQEGIEPEWVQVGNETPNGMLWPMGKVEKPTPTLPKEKEIEQAWDHYAGLTTAGYEAAKEVFSEITVIVHVDNAYERRDWFWENLSAHGGKWDMIGLSHYPMMSAWNGGKSWQEMNELAEANIRRLIQDWHCPVMIAEVGMFANDSLSPAVMADFIQRITTIDSCAGIFYWEPQVYGGWRPAEYIPLGWGSYEMGAFTQEGQPDRSLQIMLQSEKL
ncbi:MAG: glycosyl hydrolase 53 family protein [Paludibacteraceae bacterium]|nr:glycosyl hydrolase 53 family protein [Paludibacteraceae bacterium]